MPPPVGLAGDCFLNGCCRNGRQFVDHAPTPPGVSPLWRKRIARFSYWEVSELNPWAPRLAQSDDVVGWVDGDPEWASKLAHAEADADYRSRFDSGDTGALFEYVANDSWAFREPWVIRAAEHLAAVNPPDHQRLMALWKQETRGSATLRSLCDQIGRDLRILRTILEELSSSEALKSAILSATVVHACSESSAKEIYYGYDGVLGREAPLAALECVTALEAIQRRLEASIAGSYSNPAN